MENNLKAVFELSRAAMLAVENNRIIHLNSRAGELFGSEICGRSAVGIVPEHILSNASDSFVSSAHIDGRSYCVYAAKSDKVLYLSFASDDKSGMTPEFISDTLLSSMLSSLCNIGMAIDRVEAETEGSASPRLDDYLTILNHSYYNMRHSVLNLSTAIALKNGSLPFSFHVVDLARLCSELVSTASVMALGMGIDICFTTSLGELYGWADGEKVERIILNIITNSLAHTPRGGRISIGLERSGDNAYISVDDNGSGIPAAEMAELFTRFEQENGKISLTSRSTGGLGLGIARGLCEAHGGALIIESREGKGTCVRVMLPLQSAKMTLLESGSQDYVNSGMSLILTEMAPVLGTDSYARQFLE